MGEPGYRVALDRFHGPLDLLLFLIKSQELDIHDIPVSVVTDQYMSYLGTLELLDVNLASEFLVMAATLIELKSRCLIPVEQVVGGDDLDEVEDPRSDLVRKLLEYKQFRDMAEHLENLRSDTEARFAGGGDPYEAATFDDGLDGDLGSEVTLWDLLAAFQKLIREVALSGPQTIVYDDTPIVAHMERVLDFLASRGRTSFKSIFAGRSDRGFVIGTFLALLELCKLLTVRASESPTGEIELIHCAPAGVKLSDLLAADAIAAEAARVEAEAFHEQSQREHDDDDRAVRVPGDFVSEDGETEDLDAEIERDLKELERRSGSRRIEEPGSPREKES